MYWASLNTVYSAVERMCQVATCTSAKGNFQLYKAIISTVGEHIKEVTSHTIGQHSHSNTHKVQQLASHVTIEYTHVYMYVLMLFNIYLHVHVYNLTMLSYASNCKC